MLGDVQEEELIDRVEKRNDEGRYGGDEGEAFREGWKTTFSSLSSIRKGKLAFRANLWN